MLRFLIAPLLVSGLCVGSALAQESLERRAEAIRPPAELVRYQNIPWVLDLTQAIQLAKDENRPIFFWAAGGRDRDGVPLERC
jgi:hypothetical protein